MIRVRKTLYGDTTGTLDTLGADQTLLARGKTPTVYGDALDILGGVGGNDIITGAKGKIGITVVSTLFGDARTIVDGVGGDDVIQGGSPVPVGGGPVTNVMYGDALEMRASLADKATAGGDDRITGGDGAINRAFGDAQTLSCMIAGAAGVFGGDDTMTGGTGGENTFTGDGALTGLAFGGDDRLQGGDGAFNTLTGDGAMSMVVLPGNIYLAPRGGNDTLIGGNGIPGGTATGNGLVGDGSMLSVAFYVDGQVRIQAGNDSLVGGSDCTYGNSLVGDYQSNEVATLYFAPGNDTLVSGARSDDVMTGDGGFFRGADRFVFAPENGHDRIFDFDIGTDKIDLTAFDTEGIHDFSGLQISQVGGGVNGLIDFGGGNDIVLDNVYRFEGGVAVLKLTAADFIFA